MQTSSNSAQTAASLQRRSSKIGDILGIPESQVRDGVVCVVCVVCAVRVVCAWARKRTY